MAGPTVIIGAGLAGLSCALHMRERPIVLEREERVGGLTRTNERDGFHFDFTGHWLHLRDSTIRSLIDSLLGDDLVHIERRAAVYLRGRANPYPFQANTYGWPPEIVADCLLGYFRAREQKARGAVPAPSSFADYVDAELGDGIARHFMVPYNTKLWTVPPSEMSFEWCKRFVPIPTPEEVVLGAIRPGGANAALGYNASFLYPRRGGIEILPQRIAARAEAELRLGTSVVEVDWSSRRVRIDDGSWLGYQTLVTTMPLDRLVLALVDPPETIRDAASLLRAASVTYWDLGLASPAPTQAAQWTYYPEPGIGFYRVGSPSAVSPNVAPANHRSLYVEISHPQGTSCPADDEKVAADLREVGLLGEREEPVVHSRNTIECAYVIMNHDYGAARNAILDWLRAQRIFSIGRYGGWTYGSMEDALIDGLEAASALEGGR